MIEVAGGIILAMIIILLAPFVLWLIFKVLMLPITLINTLPDTNAPAKPKLIYHTTEPEDEFTVHS